MIKRLSFSFQFLVRLTGRLLQKHHRLHLASLWPEHISLVLIPQQHFDHRPLFSQSHIRHRLRYAFRQRQSQPFVNESADLSVFVRSTKHSRNEPHLLCRLSGFGSSAIVCCSDTKASGDEAVHAQFGVGNGEFSVDFVALGSVCC